MSGAAPRGPVVVIALLLAATAPLAAATATDATRQPTATRSIEPTSAAPGEAVTVRVTVEVPEDEDKLSIEEQFDPALSNVTVEDVRFESGDGSVLLAIGRGDALIVAMEAVSAGSEFTLVYTAEVPDDVGSDEVTVDGAVGQDDETTVIGGDASVTVERRTTSTTTTSTTAATTSTTTTSTPATTTTSTTATTTTADSTTSDSTATTSGTGTDGTTASPTTADATGGTTTADAGTTADDTDDGSGGQSLPGFGVVVAVLAVLAGGALAARRRGR